jgi:hypothetical protein
MGERKDDAPGELDDEQLSNVSGGAGLGSADSPVSVQPGPPELTAPLPVAGQGDIGTGMASGKRQHKPLVIKKDPDPTMA